MTDLPSGKVDSLRIAALLDGELLPVEREALLAALAAAGMDYEVFVDTAAVLVEAESRRVPSWRTWPRRANRARAPRCKASIPCLDGGFRLAMTSNFSASLYRYLV